MNRVVHTQHLVAMAWLLIVYMETVLTCTTNKSDKIP